MKPSEIADLLTAAAKVDRWVTPDDLTVVGRWHELIGGEQWLTPALARAALDAHQRADPRTVTPADILRIAAEIRRDRLARTALPSPPPGLAGNPAAWRAALDAGQAAIVAGTDPAEAMASAAIEVAARRELDGGAA